MKTTLVFGLFLSSSIVFAGDAGTVAEREKRICPNVSEDARTLISSIRTIQDDLKKLPECQSLNDKVSVLSRTITDPRWKQIKSLFSGNATPAIEGEELESFTVLANDAATALADSVALLGGSSNHCVPPKRKGSFLSVLSGITREVSTVAGSVAGPYGQGINLVGNLIASSISGIDKLFKQNKVYDFNKVEEELLFMNQFCSYAEIQQDIKDYEQLEHKIAELTRLEEVYLKTKVKDLIENCKECAYYKIAHDASFQAERVLQRMIPKVNVIAQGTMPAQRTTINRCIEIERAFFTTNSDFKQYIELLRKYENPGMSESDRELIQTMTKEMESMVQEVYPRYTQCNKDPEVPSNRFNDFMRDGIFRFNETIFGHQMAQFQFLANKRYKFLNGDSIAKSMANLKWSRNERRRIEIKLQEENLRFSKELVKKQANELRTRMAEQLMPIYLDYRFDTTRWDIKDYLKEFRRFKARELLVFSNFVGKDVEGISELVSELKLTQNRDFAEMFPSSYAEVVAKSEIIILGVENNERYCNYLKYTRTLVPRSRQICMNGMETLRNMSEWTLELRPDIAALADFEKWAVENLNIQATNVMDYAARIEAWRTRTDRWELAQNVDP